MDENRSSASRGEQSARPNTGRDTTTAPLDPPTLRAPSGQNAGDRPLPDRRALWFAFLGAPIAWAANFLLGYAIQATVCNAGHDPGLARLLPLISSLLAAAVALAAALVGYRSWRHTGTGEENPESRVGAAAGRSWFMAYGGLLTSLLFLLAIVLTAVVELTVSPCGGA